MAPVYLALCVWRGEVAKRQSDVNFRAAWLQGRNKFLSAQELKGNRKSKGEVGRGVKMAMTACFRSQIFHLSLSNSTWPVFKEKA